MPSPKPDELIAAMVDIRNQIYVLKCEFCITRRETKLRVEVRSHRSFVIGTADTVSKLEWFRDRIENMKDAPFRSMAYKLGQLSDRQLGCENIISQRRLWIEPLLRAIVSGRSDTKCVD